MSSVNVTLSAPAADVLFPFGTKDDLWTFTLTGTNADGSAYNPAPLTSSGDAVSASLPAGATVTLVVTKNGVASLASDPYVVDAPTTVSLKVPDAGQKATITAAA